ncbi:ABC transporter ATP-binding protein [Paenibacillus thiaminolyticus]|uniref:ABC transporter ATP-binding protein n=2 Tax=Paenibacillus thiaminolyticus TaxID=49283 RepID=A0ABT4FX60_PANTH|nr:ABC transporter ATP-binding protein [Paenibacillus thiaminolyticus]MCY9535803.1 ABC transporter ATP-binding protein [Paenibacillus thiaminolyticus]MCY9605420.1 ABC transporter ATP-binding protein [Paenibacillus thiaminolyticus]MCY9608615.1 ABC transporter ATP-binding protein [Paenibacillus thiaminolyticus]MCY9613361.1 ABC transporter ATP-binding protein [Paenibacillus thiaminolyticus]MCY9619535.1 ABC transporter ATP-binding protein [Paenibacillus thiaminolyticus]
MIPAVEMSQVTHVYVTEREAKLAIERLSVMIMPGEFVSLVGPSGCGKTTILSIIAGLLEPTHGSVRVYGNAVAGPSPRVGYMLQSDYLYPWRTILENASLGLELTKRWNRESEELVRDLLNGMGLGGTEASYPHQLSGGMRQRVALVRTLATSPELLLLDEPFSALDYQTKLQLEDLVVDTLKARRKTAVLVTHDLSEAIAVSDRVIVLNRDPGSMRKAFTIPDAIREAQPFFAREQPGFNEMFHELWKELEASDGKEGEHAERN